MQAALACNSEDANGLLLDSEPGECNIELPPTVEQSTILTSRQRNLIEEALLIEQEEARSAGALGFMSRTLRL